jgi:hypothetical protein
MLNPETEFRINSPQSSATAPATQPNKTPNVRQRKMQLNPKTCV